MKVTIAKLKDNSLLVITHVEGVACCQALPATFTLAALLSSNPDTLPRLLNLPLPS